MNDIGKFPIEVFGYDFRNQSPTVRLAYNQQYCRFIQGTWVKPRKSELQIKVGICSLGATVNKGKPIYPVICPQRFKEDSMFQAIRENYLSSWKNVKWIKEVNIGVGGNIDYVAVEVDEYDRIKDFLCVEVQAAGTTGTPYPYVKELIESGKYSGKRYTYGINWANEFSKTMMQQAYKKGKIIEYWKRKIVFVLQNVAMDYLYATADCSMLVESNPSLSIDFCSFELRKNDSCWSLVFDRIKSTNTEGINRLLGGKSVEAYPTEDEFIGNIIKKGLADGVLSNNSKLGCKLC